MERSLLPLLLLALSPPLAAQQLAFRIDGEGAGDRLGGHGNDWREQAVDLVGDVDQDGWQDLVVGAPEGGYVKLISGRDGATIFRWTAPTGDHIGSAVGGAGDVDADGIPDVVVGASLAVGWAGKAYVFSGATGATLFTFTGYGGADYLGDSVAGAGDIDQDGHDDVVLGAPQNPGRGYVQVRSGADGSLLYEWTGPASYSQYGWEVCGPGDVDQDGYPDVVICANGNNSSPYSTAEVRSGADGSILYFYQEPSSLPWGDRTAPTGDVDGDGHPDFAIGTGPTRIYSGRDGSILYEIYSTYNRIGNRLGDVDGDGLADFALGDIYTDLVDVLSGATGAVLQSITPPAGEFRGGSIASAGDQNLDGVPDLLLGCPHASYAGTDAGAAYVYDLDGPPAIHLTVPPLVRGALATLTAAPVQQGSTTWFLYSTQGAGPWTDPVHGITVMLSPPIRRAGSAYAFQASTVYLTVTVPAGPPAGLPVWLQAVEASGNPPGTFRVSNLVATSLQ